MNPPSVVSRVVGWPPFAPIVLLLLNVFLARELFFTEYTQYMGSIEAAYIGLSRYYIENPLAWDWFPLWYVGVPFQNTYPPILHMMVALFAAAANVSTALSHHFVTAAIFAFGPVTLYWWTRRLGVSRPTALVAGVVYSLTAPAPALTEAVSTWPYTAWHSYRLHSLVVYGDGPHIASIAFLPLALLALDSALRRPSLLRLPLAAAALAFVVLTNWLGAFALALGVVSYFAPRVGSQGWIRQAIHACGIGALAYGLAAPWIPPSTIMAIRHNAQHTIGNYPMTSAHVFYWAAVIVTAALLVTLLHRTKASPAIWFSALFALLNGVIVVSEVWFGIALMPQPHRYRLEMEMGICLLLVLLLAKSYAKLPRWGRAAALLVLALFCIVQVRSARWEARDRIRAINIEETAEYQAANWIHHNLGDQRVYASGSTHFWLLAFADTPQIGGGFGQGIVNKQIPIIDYGIPFTEGDGETTALWLRVYGAKAVLTHDDTSTDYYAYVWRDPHKFDGVLPEIWRNAGERIYGVPQRSRSLAHVIRREHVVTDPPINNSDTEQVAILDAALEDPSLPLADLEWVTPSHARITATLAPDQLLFVQESAHHGWVAHVAGRPVPIEREGLGFMVIEPDCEGPCQVDLTFDGGLEMKAAKALSLLSTILVFFWGYRARAQR